MACAKRTSPAITPAWNDWSYTQEYNVLGRWTHRRDNGASLQVQSSFDFRHNDDTTNPKQRLADIEAQYHAAAWRGHDVVVGAGYRLVDERVPGGFSFSITPNAVDETVVNAFAQDEVALGPRVKLTFGAKLERDSFVGWGPQTHGARDVDDRAAETAAVGRVSRPKLLLAARSSTSRAPLAGGPSRR